MAKRIVNKPGNFGLEFYSGSTSGDSIPRYRYTPSGERIDNITNWAVATFTAHYGTDAGITRDAILAYVYAALHDPLWRDTTRSTSSATFPASPCTRISDAGPTGASACSTCTSGTSPSIPGPCGAPTPPMLAPAWRVCRPRLC